jgi:hypothetical protein
MRAFKQSYLHYRLGCVELDVVAAVTHLLNCNRHYVGYRRRRPSLLLIVAYDVVGKLLHLQSIREWPNAYHQVTEPPK